MVAHKLYTTLLCEDGITRHVPSQSSILASMIQRMRSVNDLSVRMPRYKSIQALGAALLVPAYAGCGLRNSQQIPHGDFDPRSHLCHIASTPELVYISITRQNFILMNAMMFTDKLCCKYIQSFLSMHFLLLYSLGFIPGSES